MACSIKIKECLFRKVFLLSILGIIAISLIGTVSAQSVSAPTVTKTTTPTNINLAGSGVAPEETKVAITVTGAGNNSSSAIPMDVVFAIDCSGSMGYNDPSNLRLSAAQNFIDKLNSSRDTAGFDSWDTQVESSHTLTSDFTTLKSEIGKIVPLGNTNLNIGLGEAISILNANTRTGDSAKVIIFLTDGQQNTGTYDSTLASTAASKGYKIYTIGLGNSVETSALLDMANKTGGKYYSSPDSANLQEIYNNIFKNVVASTIPQNVDVVEATPKYILVNNSSFNIKPNSVVTDSSGITTITWKNIGNGDGSSDLKANEKIVLSFNAKSNKAGNNLGVDVLGTAKVNYKDSKGNNAGSVGIPQAYINVKDTKNTSKSPVADFCASPKSGNVPLKVQFMDESTNTPTSWKWSFGDGTTSTNKNPSHTYSKTGKYTVSLTVKNAAGSNTITKSSYINVAAPVKAPIAVFTASPKSGKAPLKVQFTDKSTNTPTSWKWNFGDGKYSTTKNPSHTYSKTGKYTISLTVKNAKGSNTKTVSKYILVTKK